MLKFLQTQRNDEEGIKVVVKGYFYFNTEFIMNFIKLYKKQGSSM